MIDDGEEAEAAARRELLEETGFSARRFVLLGQSRPNPALQNNTIYHYLAADCEKTADASLDEHESVVTRMVSIEEAERLIARGAITHSLVVAAFYYFSIFDRKEEK
jgi:8-oxo-dGTP pyrophosphatase MutT (NUDIX family)